MRYVSHPLCNESEERRTTCFACYMDRCNILNDTNFYFKECPFYKTREELKSQLEKIEEENKKLWQMK